jgi:hypothetical protein
MKKTLVDVLLRILNSQWLNPTPCKYGFIGNVDAFDIESLRYEVKSRPSLLVAQLIAEAETFKACPLRLHGVTVIEDGTTRDATVWELRELQNLGKP